MKLRYATYGGKRYRLVPWIKPDNCDGCVFHHADKQCPNDFEGEPCSEDGKYGRMVLIECGKEGLAKYIAKKLEGCDETNN